MGDLAGIQLNPATAPGMLGTQFQVSAQVVKTAVEVQQTIPELLLSQQGLGQLIDISA